MRQVLLLGAAVLLVGIVVDRPAAQRALSPVTDAMLREPATADWLMWRRTLDSPGNKWNPDATAEVRWGDQTFR